MGVWACVAHNLELWEVVVSNFSFNTPVEGDLLPHQLVRLRGVPHFTDWDVKTFTLKKIHLGRVLPEVCLRASYVPGPVQPEI